MAYNIGAKVTGKEWNDEHPGQAENPAACFDGWHGMFERKPGLTGVEIHHDLGMEMNYIAYMEGNPLEGGPPGMHRNSTVSGALTDQKDLTVLGIPPTSWRTWDGRRAAFGTWAGGQSPTTHEGNSRRWFFCGYGDS